MSDDKKKNRYENGKKQKNFVRAARIELKLVR